MNELLKVRDIQARLGIGRSAVYALIHEPTFPIDNSDRAIRALDFASVLR